MKNEKKNSLSLSLPPKLLLTDPQAPPYIRPGDPPQAYLPLDGLGPIDGKQHLENTERRRDQHRSRDRDGRQKPSCFAQQAEGQTDSGQDARQHQRRGRDGARYRRAVGDLPEPPRGGGAAAISVRGEGEPSGFEVVPPPRVPGPEGGPFSRREAGEGEAEGREEGQGDGRDGGLEREKEEGEEGRGKEERGGEEEVEERGRGERRGLELQKKREKQASFLFLDRYLPPSFKAFVLFQYEGELCYITTHRPCPGSHLNARAER
jgi:hypothetical protein